MVSFMPVINVKHATVIYNNNVVANDDVNLRIEEGDFIFILGRNGSGKSTLLRLITRDIDPTEGAVYFDDRNMKDFTRKEMPFFRRQFGIIWQEPLLVQHKTVFENVALAMFAVGQTEEVIKMAVPAALGLVGIRKKADVYPKELSGGERFKVALARAVVNNPKILIADEPTANLDRDTAWDIVCLLDEINRLGITVVVATHAQELVNIMRKRVVTMTYGRLMGDVRKGKYGDII